MSSNTDFIDRASAETLPALFLERVKRSREKTAFTQFDSRKGQWEDFTWADVASRVERWKTAFANEHLSPGDRVAILLHNCVDWVTFDQAALALGLVVVPVYTDDRSDNICYILENAGVKCFLLGHFNAWPELRIKLLELDQLQRVIRVEDDTSLADDQRFVSLEKWLSAAGSKSTDHDCKPDDLATLVYTSGTTGQPKGVKLTHRNLLSNCFNGLEILPAYPDDIALSFLPLSHTFERTVGYYCFLVAGARIAYARSIQSLAEDLAAIRPTVLVAVPRVYDRIFARIRQQLKNGPAIKRVLFNLAVSVGWKHFEYCQGRTPWHPRLMLHPLTQRLVGNKITERLGGRVRLSICGGAALPAQIARTFVGLGLPLIQGYGMTETSPIITANRYEENVPSSVGKPLPGIEVRIGDNDELLTRSACVTSGYWENEEATRALIDEDSWLHTGDKVRVDELGFYYITGRIKDIIVLSNGEKIPPNDIEHAIQMDPLIDQVLIIGEALPFLSAIVVLANHELEKVLQQLRIDRNADNFLQDSRLKREVQQRISAAMHAFPGYAQIRRVSLTIQPWTIENGFLTPTMKLKRNEVAGHFRTEIEKMYAGYN